MDKVLTYTLRKEDMDITAGGLVNLVLKNCVKVTGHEISAAKFTPDGITCDSRLIHVSERMRPGQTLRVVLPEEKDETKLIAMPGPVRILYEDEDLIAVDKLAGEVVHPGPGHYTDTVANYVTWYLQGGDAAADNPASGSPPSSDAVSSESLSSSAAAPAENTTASAAAPAKAAAAVCTGRPASSAAVASGNPPSSAAGLRIIGRLDKETSGVLIFAKNRAAAARLQRQRREGAFVRTYLAVCEGTFPEAPGSGTPESFCDEKSGISGHGPWYRKGTIDLPLEKEPGVLMRMRVAPEGGMRAVTHYEVLKEFHAETDLPHPRHAPASSEERMEEAKGTARAHADASSPAARSLLRVTIETGRTHQIRVHMASIGHPLVGDTLYGSRAVKNPDHVKSMPDIGDTAPGKDNAPDRVGGPACAFLDDAASCGSASPGMHALLHAQEVRLRQPFTEKDLRIVSRLWQQVI